VLADPNVGEGEGGGLADTRSVRKADGNGVTVFQKVRQYPAEHKGDSAIPQSSANRDSYFTDRPGLKNRPLTGEGLPTVAGCLSEPGEDGVQVNSTNPEEQACHARPSEGKGRGKGDGFTPTERMCRV